MKKIIKSLLVVMIITMVVMAFAACKEPVVDPCAEGHTMVAFGEDLPTCTEDGLSSGVVCTVCGYAERNRFPIPAKGHKMADATCELPSTCTVCGHTEGEALGHSMKEVEALAPTCTAEGYTAHTACERCDLTEGKEVVEKIAHSFTIDVEALAPTCTEDGYTAHKACECGEVEGKETIPAAHTWTDVEALAPTCTEDGYTAHKVCACGATEGKETIPAAHSWTDVEAKAPTCTEDGYTAHKACACGEKEGYETIAASGHTWTDVEAKASTCTEDGYTAHKACACGATEGKKVIAKGHVDANLDIECDREGCTSKVAPPADSVLSTYTANCLGSKVSTDSKYYVEGTIVEVLDARNGIFLIDDGTGEKFYFRLPVNADGISHANWAIKLVLGDKVQVYGKINKFSSSTAPNGQYWPAMQAPVVTILEQHPHDFTFKAATCSEPAYCACGQSQGKPLGCADTDGDQLCDDCGRNVNYAYEYVEIRTDNESGIIDTTAGTYTWGNDNFLVYVEKGTSSQLYSTAKDHMRVYKGNNFVLVNKNGLAVKTITVYVTNATQVANFEKFLTGYTYVKDEENFTITFEVDALETLTLTNTASTTQVKGVEFGYEKPEEPALSNAVLDLTTKDNRTYYDAADKQVWEANGIKLTNTKGDSTSNVQDKAPFAAWAKGYVIIEGKGIKTIRVVCSTTTLGTFFGRSLKAVENPNFTYSNSGTTYTIVFNEEVDIFELYLTDQTAFKSITINPEA